MIWVEQLFRLTISVKHLKKYPIYIGQYKSQTNSSLKMIEFFDSLSWITEFEKSSVKIDHNLSNVKRKGDKIISQKLLRNHDFCLEAWERDKTTVHCIGYALNSILFHNGANFSSKVENILKCTLDLIPSHLTQLNYGLDSLLEV